MRRDNAAPLRQQPATFVVGATLRVCICGPCAGAIKF
jgi:hypothetical protein